MAIRDPFDPNDLPEGYEYGEAMDALNEANALLNKLEAIYERIKPLVELADSAPNYRLAVVDLDAWPYFEYSGSNTPRAIFRRVVKMEEA